MKCTLCGNEIAEGQRFCSSCGAPVQQNVVQPQQPIQPMGGFVQPQQPMQQAGGFVQPQQPMQQAGGFVQPQQQAGGFVHPQQPMQQAGGYTQPQQPMGGYAQPPKKQIQFGNNSFVNYILGDVMNIAKLLGAFLICLTPFLTWCRAKFWGESESRNMFGLHEECGVMVFFGIMLLLIGLVLIAWEISFLVPQIEQIKSKIAGIPYIELILVGIALLFVILALANGDINDAIKLVKDWGGKAGHGAGPVFGFIGIILAAGPRVLDILKINLHYSLKK